jgi:membrane protein
VIKRTVWFGSTLRRTAVAAMDHDVLTVAQATAYSAIVAVFPALILAAALVALMPDSVPLRSQMAMFFDRILPSNVSPILDSYFSTVHKSPQTTGALLSAAAVSLTGAMSVMSTLMEGFRRAHRQPLGRKTFWIRRRRALELVPLSLLPMTVASALVVFGHMIAQWTAREMSGAMLVTFYAVAYGLRWAVALAGSTGILAVIYHLGTDVTTHLTEHLMPPERGPLLRLPMQILRKQWTWRASLPGAALATALWFVSTLLFGFYVTRFANYSRVYGSLGAAIALLFWLYLVALCVLIGAEFNAQVAAQRQHDNLKEVAVGREKSVVRQVE